MMKKNIKHALLIFLILVVGFFIYVRIQIQQMKNEWKGFSEYLEKTKPIFNKPVFYEKEASLEIRVEISYALLQGGLSVIYSKVDGIWRKKRMELKTLKNRNGYVLF
jgi:hypothetical protein